MKEFITWFFKNDMAKYVGSVLFGAIISAFIVHNFTKKRENKRLKIDIQLKCSEQMLECIKAFGDSSSKMFIPTSSVFTNYNTTIQHNPKLETNDSDSFNTNYIINDLKAKKIEQSKDNIINTMDTYMELWIIFYSSFLSIISILESKEVILNKFIGFKTLALVEFDKLSKIHNDIMHLYHFEITQNMIAVELIEENYTKTLNEYEYEFMEKRIDIGSIMWDLKVGIQNEFLSKLFKYKVPLRKPLDKNIPVYKAGYVYKEVENKMTSNN